MPDPVTSKTEEKLLQTVYSGTIVPSRVFQATMALRWRVPPHTTTERPVLEQAWQSMTGEIEWRPVPKQVVP